MPYGPSFDAAKAQIKDALGLPQRIQALRAPPPQQQPQSFQAHANPMLQQVPAGAPGPVGAQQPQPMATRFGGTQVGLQGQGGGLNINLGPSGQFQGADASVGKFNVGAALDDSMKLQNMQARYNQGPFSATANYSPNQGIGGGVQYQSGPFSASGGYSPNQGAYGSVGLRQQFQEGGLATSLRQNRDDYRHDEEFVDTSNRHMRDMVGKPVAKGGGVWTRKEGQNPEGGLNAKGRASLKAQGHDIKPPVSAKQAKKSPKAAARRSSFCARMSGMEGPMKDDNGKPTRKALALRKWDC